MFTLSGWVNNTFSGLLNARPAPSYSGAVNESSNVLAAPSATSAAVHPSPASSTSTPAPVSHQTPTPRQPTSLGPTPGSQGGPARQRYGLIDPDQITSHHHHHQQQQNQQQLQQQQQQNVVPSLFFNRNATLEARQVQIHQNQEIQSRVHSASPSPATAPNTYGADAANLYTSNQQASAASRSHHGGRKRAADDGDLNNQEGREHQGYGPGAMVLDRNSRGGDATAAGGSDHPTKRRAVQSAQPPTQPATAWWAPKPPVRDLASANIPTTPLLAITNSTPVRPDNQQDTGSSRSPRAGVMVVVSGPSGAGGLQGGGPSATGQVRSVTPDMRAQLQAQVWQRDQNRARNLIQSQKRPMPGSPHGGIKKWAPPMKRRYSAVPQMNDDHEFEEGNGGPLCREAQTATTRQATQPTFALNPLVPSSQPGGAISFGGGAPAPQLTTDPSTARPATTSASATGPSPAFNFFGAVGSTANATLPSGAVASSAPSMFTSTPLSPVIAPSSAAAGGGFLDRLLAAGPTPGSAAAATTAATTAAATASGAPVGGSLFGSSLATAVTGSTSASALLAGTGGITTAATASLGAASLTAPVTPSFNFGAPVVAPTTAANSAAPSGLPIFNFGPPAPASPTAAASSASAFAPFNFTSATAPTAPASPRNPTSAPAAAAAFNFTSSLPSSTPSAPNFFASAAAQPPSSSNPFLSTPATAPAAAAPSFGGFGFGTAPAAAAATAAASGPSFAFGGGGFGTQPAAPGIGSFGVQSQPAAAVASFGSFPSGSSSAFSFGAGGPSAVSPALMAAANTPLPSQQQPSFFGAAQQPPPTPNFGFNAASLPSFGSPFPATFGGQPPAAAAPSFGGQQQGMYGAPLQQQPNFGAGPPAAAPDPGGGFNVGAGAAAGNAGQRRVVAARRAGRR